MQEMWRQGTEGRKNLQAIEIKIDRPNPVFCQTNEIFRGNFCKFALPFENMVNDK